MVGLFEGVPLLVQGNFPILEWRLYFEIRIAIRPKIIQGSLFGMLHVGHVACFIIFKYVHEYRICLFNSAWFFTEEIKIFYAFKTGVCSAR